MIDYEKVALKILHHAKEGEYDSELAKSDYFNWKKGFFKKREVILENYAKQVCYRHEFRKIAKMLNEYADNLLGNKVGCKLTQAQMIIGISNKIESICNNHKDNETMNDIMEELLFNIYPFIDTEYNKVTELHEFKEQEFTLIKKCIACLNQLEQKEDKEL